MSAAVGFLQTDNVAPQSIVHTQNIQRPSNSVRPIYRHRPDVVRGNCDLPSPRMLDSSFCPVVGGASLLYFAAVVCAPNFSKVFLLSATFSISLLPYPRSCLVFCSRDVGSAVPTRVAPSTFCLRGESPLLPPAFRGGARLYCTVLNCTVRQF